MRLIFFAFFEKIVVPILTSGGLAAVSSSAFAALYSAFGKYDVVHIHAEGPAFFCWLPKLFGKRVVVTIHGIDWQREKWQSGLGSKFIHQGEKNAVKYADEHDANVLGAQRHSLKDTLRGIVKNKNVLRSDMTKEILKGYSEMMPEKTKEAFITFAEYKENLKYKLKILMLPYNKKKTTKRTFEKVKLRIVFNTI